MPSNRYINIYERTESELTVRPDLASVSELEAMARAKVYSRISRLPETSRVLYHTNYLDVVCIRVGCHHSRQLDSPKRLYVREAIVHASFDTSSNVITYIIGHERTTAHRGASYSPSRPAESSNVSTIETGA